MLRARQVDQEAEHHQHVGPPEEAGEHRRGKRGNPAPGAADQRAVGRPEGAAGSDVGENLEEEEGDEHERDQAEDSVGVGHAVQVAAERPGSQHRAAIGEGDEGEEGGEEEEVEQDGEGAAADDRQLEVEAHRPEVERVELDDEEAPEGEEVGDAGQWIAQHAALAEHHQGEILDAVAQAIEAVFRAAQAQQADERADAHGEERPCRDKDDGEDDGADDATDRPEGGWTHGVAPLPVCQDVCG